MSAALATALAVSFGAWATLGVLAVCLMRACDSPEGSPKPLRKHKRWAPLKARTRKPAASPLAPVG